jgi:hypothetical protein
MKLKLFIIIYILCFISCKKLEIERSTMLSPTQALWTENKLTTKSGIIDLSNNPTHEYGFVYALNKEPFLGVDSAIILGNTSSPIQFETAIPNISAGAVYYIRSFVKSGNEVVYGNVYVISTNPQQVSVDCFNTIPNNTDTVIYNGKINNLGNLVVAEYGHCWSSVTAAPTIADYRNYSSNLGIDGYFQSTIRNLALDSIYYVRSYIQLTNGQYLYSNAAYALLLKSHRTVMLSAGLNSNNDLNMQGRYNQLGSDPIIEYGFCWSVTNPIPTINENKHPVMNPPTEGVTFSLAVPKPQSTSVTDYYFRTYVIVDNQVIYSSNVIKSTF